MASYEKLQGQRVEFYQYLQELDTFKEKKNYKKNYRKKIKIKST